jgi:cytochrome c oxidase subunit 2
MKHVIVVAVLVVASTFLVHIGLTAVGLLPLQASEQAVAVDELFGVHLWLISFLFSLIVMTLFYSLVVFRRRAGDTGDGAYFTGSTALELAWTGIPLVAVLYLAFIGAQSLAVTRRVDRSALQVKVLAGQWFWQFQYPGLGITSTDLYMPLDKQVDFQMTSNDVIHSFWVPEFRLKQDIVPGQTTELRITPTLTGTFTLRCAELCGTRHAYMEGAVHVVTQEEFAAWVKTQQSSVVVDPVARGEQLAAQYGCESCHSTDGSKKIGPTWAKLYGSEVPLADGSTAVADDAYLEQSIVNPDAQIVAGYPAGVMPSFATTLDQTQVESIIAYIKSMQ